MEYNEVISFTPQQGVEQSRVLEITNMIHVLARHCSEDYLQNIMIKLKL